MWRKIQVLIGLSLIALVFFMLLMDVNYDLYELKLGIKAMAGQQFTLAEMKSTAAYKAFSEIDMDTTVEAATKLLGKKSKTVMPGMETWYYPYGYVSVLQKRNGEPGLVSKMVSFETPYVKKLSEDELRSVFKCTSSEVLAGILGEPGIITETYDWSDPFAGSGYEWGIKAGLSKELVNELKKQYGDYVSFPRRYSSPVNFMGSMTVARKLRLHVSVNSEGTIESIDVKEYRE